MHGTVQDTHMETTKRTNRKPAGRTISQNPSMAGQFIAEKRAEGFDVEHKMHGSDSKRGSRPWIEIVWYAK